MLRIKSVFGAMIAIALVAGPVLAAGSGGSSLEHGDKVGGILEPNLGTAVFTLLIFGVLVVILRLTAWKPIISGLKSRENAIRESIEAAARAKAEADRATKELEAKMSEARAQAATELAQAKADAQKLAENIRKQAETESAAMKDRALREIEAAKTQALGEINAHAADIGTAVAKKILQRNVTVDDQQRLVEDSLREMAAKN